MQATATSLRFPPLTVQVEGLLLSTPVETVPILVTYDAVRGGVFFHTPPLPDRFRRDTPEGGLTAKEERKTSAAGTDSNATELDAAELDQSQEVAVHLENAFPGRTASSGVSLLSTASWEGRVEGIGSTSPLVQATLTRTDVPGVAAGGRSEREEAGSGSDGVVEVRPRFFNLRFFRFLFCGAGLQSNRGCVLFCPLHLRLQLYLKKGLHACYFLTSAHAHVGITSPVRIPAIITHRAVTVIYRCRRRRLCLCVVLSLFFGRPSTVVGYESEAREKKNLRARLLPVPVLPHLAPSFLIFFPQQKQKVGRVEYNASRDCVDLDAWACVAKRVEALSSDEEELGTTLLR